MLFTAPSPEQRAIERARFRAKFRNWAFTVQTNQHPARQQRAKDSARAQQEFLVTRKEGRA